VTRERRRVELAVVVELGAARADQREEVLPRAVGVDRLGDEELLAVDVRADEVLHAVMLDFAEVGVNDEQLAGRDDDREDREHRLGVLPAGVADVEDRALVDELEDLLEVRDEVGHVREVREVHLLDLLDLDATLDDLDRRERHVGRAQEDQEEEDLEESVLAHVSIVPCCGTITVNSVTVLTIRLNRIKAFGVNPRVMS